MVKLLYIASFIVFIGCTSDVDRIPEPKELIPKDKMIVVVREMVKLESHIKTKYVQVSVYHDVMVQSGDSLLRSFGLTKVQFESSLDYYGSRQEVMQEIYTEALEDLNREVGDLESEFNK